MNKKIWLSLGAIVVIALLIAGGYKLKKSNLSKPAVSSKNDITMDQAKAKVADFINNNLVQDGNKKVDIKKVTDGGALYKISLSLQGKEITAYMTKDGKTFFPNPMDIASVEAQAKQAKQKAAEAPKSIPKSDKPNVKLFVMSYCPYGTQVEKGILPVLNTLGNKINFQLEFVDYSMHNDLATNDMKELNENVRQYCIQKNQPKKLDAYLSCFLKKGQGTETACLNSAGVDVNQVSDCMAQADSQFSITKNFKDKKTYKGQFPLCNINKDDNAKYKVEGSPTLIINDTLASSDNRDPASLLKTICSAFNQAPEECNTKLSSTAPAPGFGEGTDTSGSSGANCKN